MQKQRKQDSREVRTKRPCLKRQTQKGKKKNGLNKPKKRSNGGKQEKSSPLLQAMGHTAKDCKV